MLKLTISSSLLKTLSTAVGHIGTEVAIVKKTSFPCFTKEERCSN